MKFFTFFLVLFLLLLIFLIIATVIRIVLRIVNGHFYDYKVLFIPSFLCLINWGIIAFVFNIVLRRTLSRGILSIIMDNILNIEPFNNSIKVVIPLFITFSIIGIVLQSLCYMTVNINYSNFAKKVKTIFYNKKKANINTDSTTLLEVNTNEIVKLKFIPALLCSLFSFSIIFASIIMLVTLGNLLSKKIVNI